MKIYADLLSTEKLQKRAQRTEAIVSIVLIMLCVLFLWTKTVWLQGVIVDGDSMNVTLSDGDHVIIDRLAPIEEGDVIVFRYGSKLFIKRVVALEGDAVTFLNGDLLVKKAGEQEFKVSIYPGVIGSSTPYVYPQAGRALTVSEGCVYVLGDNREDSTDSRLIGEVRLSDVLGVVPQWVIESKDGAWSFLYAWI